MRVDLLKIFQRERFTSQKLSLRVAKVDLRVRNLVYESQKLIYESET